MSNFKRTFGNLVSPVFLSYLDDNFSQLETASTQTTTLSGGALVNWKPTGASAVARSVQSKLQEHRSVEDTGAVGDNSTDDSTAFAGAFTDASGRRINLQGSSYRLNSAFATGGNITVEGNGGANGVPKASMVFAATPGPSGAQWDFTGSTSYPVISNVRVAHAAGAATTNGIGISFASAPYPFLERVWIENFDAGIKSTGQFFYGKLEDVVCADNKTYGFYHTGNLLNGLCINGGQFSRQTTGTGIVIDTGGSHVNMRGVYRELNSVGINIQGMHIVNDDGSYQEGQSSYDVYLPNIYPYLTAIYNLQGSYFDVVAGSGIPRVRGTLVKVNAIGNKFYNVTTNAPFMFDRIQQCTPSAFINNSYRTSYLTDIAHDPGHFVVDAKHAIFLPSFGSPTGFHARQGTTFYNTDPDTMATIFGWKVLTSGWLGTPAAVAPTATTTLNSSSVALSTNTGWYVGEGDEISIAGVTFGSPAVSSTMVLYSEPGPILIIEKSANQAVAGAAVSYPQATLQVLPGFAIAGQGAIPYSGTDIDVASGANVVLAEITIPTGSKMVVRMSSVMADEGATATGTCKTSTIFVSNNAGTIVGVVSNVTVDGGGGALAYTLSIVDGGSNRARLNVTQVTGNPLVFGWEGAFTVQNGIANRTA